MLTFEEFFQKKKINLVQFQTAEPALFAEFFSHYPLMGEKSFDHTKKYWFNILRRNYPLATEVKPHAVKAEAISDMAVQGIAVAAAQNLDETLEKPKFTEDHLAELVEENVSVKEVSLAEEEKIITETELETPVAKPAFKPRFNAKNIKKPEVETISELQTENPEPATEKPQPETEPVKPAFKPRFNMQNIKKDVVKAASEIEAETPELEAEIKSELVAENPQPATEPVKPVFKPRFNIQNIKKDVVKEALESEAKNPEPIIEKPQPETEPSTENKEAKPVYKPRFQMKNIAKPATENPPPADEPS